MGKRGETAEGRQREEMAEASGGGWENKAGRMDAGISREGGWETKWLKLSSNFVTEV
jgi:hypothetical protein